ncbi:MAG: signal peptidase I [Chloroflexi bacterium]|nr:signal peptidase I [Chloroflexota bacterium]MQF94538.1 signal peptidase I [SAR202 cluster bacterium]
MKTLLSFFQGCVNVLFSARYRVEGDSMLPSLAHGESVLVVRTRFRWNRLRKGDVALFERPGAAGGTYIKRVAGLPDEDLSVEGREWFNGPDEYFFLGDNRADSEDSRTFGPVSAGLIKGRVWFRCWPPTRWRSIGRS